ncbi:aldose 1-epimerase family protein [Tetragenococcus koreensis]|uniref:Aldose 1-epimerase n=1 Tax=Tetragenococcus koreensis TaxID=290335 RepID=A0AAN4UAK3_9ENTE|nr:aldose 1-epimerase family protein [Tetragenococcus koreensis]AYW45187.1 aldose epimerase [Tetragenococcus koreensis]MCF1585490.1 aldose 1-epimerase family protein [Tetragenococcus koreensis]MCF1615018.1 aldose 1-epimerase family protein [Tetragenococcus koreensis]MCF1617286.1 aldose 1-epimerase family protein [Tetragenococcus koreensis]MCF1622254.1 aldose 1-epimerase family protein [Tetragenococcus koreensis]
MGITIETNHLKAVLDEKGAELTSLKRKDADIEYIWQADPKYWKRHAPVLFPIVGSLKANTYTYKGKSYHLPQHGFARDMVFELIDQKEDAVSFRLKSTEETKKMYPFDFELTIGYALGGDGLTVDYQVKNTADDEMYFSIGGHPAFNVPLEDSFEFTDYYVDPSPMKSRINLPLKEGLIDLEQRTLGQTNTTIALNHELFENDALIYETKGLNSFAIRNEQSKHSVTLSFKNFSYVGIWSTYPKESPFVCIEPWVGVADTLESTGELTGKLGIQKLAAQDTFHTKYAIVIK